VRVYPGYLAYVRVGLTDHRIDYGGLYLNIMVEKGVHMIHLNRLCFIELGGSDCDVKRPSSPWLHATNQNELSSVRSTALSCWSQPRQTGSRTHSDVKPSVYVPYVMARRHVGI